MPYFRRDDVTREADLVEEVARLWGLEKLPATLPSRRGAVGVLTPEQRLRRRAEDALTGLGLSEMVGWSFAAPDLVDRLRIPPDDPRHAVVTVRNPMSEDQSVLRTTLLGSLLEGARLNRARGMPDVRLFELGAVYFDRERPGERRPEPLPDERRRLGALLAGTLRPPTWREEDPPAADFFAAKAVLAGLLDTLRVPWRVERGGEPFLHPGRAARVLVDGQEAGWLGELHPAVARAWDLEGGAAFELDLDALERAGDARAPLPGPDLLPGRAAGPGVVVRARRRGRRRGRRPCARPAARSCARPRSSTSIPRRTACRWRVRLRFRADDRTLTDEEVAQRRAKIDAAVAERLGGEPRG